MPPEYEPKYALAPASASNVASIGSHVWTGHATGVIPGRPTPRAGAIAIATKSATRTAVLTRMHTPSRVVERTIRGRRLRVASHVVNSTINKARECFRSFFALIISRLGTENPCDTVSALPAAAPAAYVISLRFCRNRGVFNIAMLP